MTDGAGGEAPDAAAAPAAVLVTGTDTGVGKTVVSAALATLWAATGDEVTYVKPAQSGADDGDDDARDVARWAPGVTTEVGAVLGGSLAPAVAARREGQELGLADLLAPVTRAAASRPQARLVVEGAGGLLVELGTDGTTCADLAAELGHPLVVVARPGLGTLNHTALTLAEADRRGLPVAGVVVSGYPTDPDLATRTNLAELARLTGGRLAGVVPALGDVGPTSLAAAAAWFAPALGGTAGPDW